MSYQLPARAAARAVTTAGPSAGPLALAPLAGAALAVIVLLVGSPPAAADGGVTFDDIAAGDGAGIDYRRVPSASNAIFDAIKQNPPYGQEERLATPLKARGAPGVALLDHDGDGDLDIYVTNGPGAANSLYSNQLVETGETTFVDVAEAAGVGAVEHDSTGVCFGDTDNDGDPDLLVLSHNAPHRFFENRGDGTFDDISARSGLDEPGIRTSAGCSFGDVDGDGLLDVAIGNTYTDWSHFRGIITDAPFALNEHNQLFLNRGGNRFVDVSAAAGVEELAGFPAEAAGAAGLTWALALVDLDLDGDVDLLTADDQGAVPEAEAGGVDRGLLHLFENDGDGNFTDVSVEVGTNVWGSWMGLAFADFNCDGTMDFFATNFGDYTPVGRQVPERQPSRWLLGTAGGDFLDPGVGTLVTTPFGWGTSAIDYDNDGDTDVVYHGGHDVGPGIEASNGGVLLRNPGCSAAFVPDFDAFAGSTDHSRRTVHGVAAGDLDGNGFVDVVSVSNLDIPQEVPLRPYEPIGSPFDQDAYFTLTFEPQGRSGELAWNGATYPNGTLSVELNNGENGNRSVAVRTRGSVGDVRGGRVNRDGIGAVVRFRPQGGPWSMRPVVGGSSYASQDALELVFGLGAAERGILEVLWPGGVRNRLYNVRAGERIVLPEIPCSFADTDQTLRSYLLCLTRSLDDLVEAGVLTEYQRVRFLMSALRARRAASGLQCSITGLSESSWLDEETEEALAVLGGF